jgi:hypothetical protein
MKSILKNRKNRIFNFAVVCVSIIAVGFFVQGCSKEEFGFLNSIDFTIEQKALLKKSAFIGEQHNLNMQKVYESLVEVKLKSSGDSPLKFTKDNVVEIIKPKTEEVIVDRSNLYADRPNKQYMKELVSKAFSVDKSVKLKNTNIESYSDSIIPYDSWVLDGLIAADVGGAVGGAIVGCVTGPGAVVVSIATSSGTSVAKLVANVWTFFFN